MGLSLVGPILHTPNNQPSTASSLVLVCSLYRRKHVPTGTAQVVPHSCSTPNETKSQAIRAQCPYFINAMRKGIWSPRPTSRWFKNTPRPYLQKGQSLLVVMKTRGIGARVCPTTTVWRATQFRSKSLIELSSAPRNPDPNNDRIMCRFVLSCAVYHFSQTNTFSMVVRYSVLNR